MKGGYARRFYLIPDFWVLIKLAVISLTIPASYLLLGEMTTEEIQFVRSVLGRESGSPHGEEETI